MAVPINIRDYSHRGTVLMGGTSNAVEVSQLTKEIEDAIIIMGEVPLSERAKYATSLLDLVTTKYPIETVLPPPMNRKERRASKKRNKNR